MAYDGLPPAAKEPIYRRLWEVLSGSERVQVLDAFNRSACDFGPPACLQDFVAAHAARTPVQQFSVR